MILSRGCSNHDARHRIRMTHTSAPLPFSSLDLDYTKMRSLLTSHRVILAPLRTFTSVPKAQHHCQRRLATSHAVCMSTAQVTHEKMQTKDPRSVHFWTAKDMPPQDGKTFLITGASSGMGYVAAENIAKKGGHVIIAARSLERSRKAADMIKVGLNIDERPIKEDHELH